MSYPIYTIGYEGIPVTQLVKALQDHDVKKLLDIRAVPRSRKVGFSKNQLHQFLQGNSIEYIGLKGLGTPPEGREAARKLDKIGLDRIYYKHLGKIEAQQELDIAAKLTKASPCCLLCYEHSPDCCHRLIVAEEISKITNVEIVHLNPW